MGADDQLGPLDLANFRFENTRERTTPVVQAITTQVAGGGGPRAGNLLHAANSRAGKLSALAAARG
jgi:hypothetical protein